MKQENYIKGMIMIILSAFFFACMNVSVRLAGDLPVSQAPVVIIHYADFLLLERI